MPHSSRLAAGTPTVSIVRQYFIALAFLVVALWGLVMLLTQQTEVLGPADPANDSWALGGASVIAAICLLVGISREPRTLTEFFRSLAGAFCVGIVSLPACWLTFARIREYREFSTNQITQRVAEFPIATARVHRGKTVSYMVELADSPTLLIVNEHDYRTAFGSAERVQATGFCIRARLQSADRKERILTGPGVSLPVGSLIHCPRAR